MDWFLKLDDDEQEFVKVLVLNSGSLKETAKKYGVSYPTIRVRLDRLLAKIQVNDEVKDPFETQIMHMVVDGKLSLDLAKHIITTYRNCERS